MSLTKYRSAIVALGLDFDLMTMHAERIRAATIAGKKPQLSIIDTCRLENGGVIAAGMLDKPSSAPLPRDFIAFVPAAGAASRYSMPLAKLLQALESGTKAELDEAFDALIAEGAERWPLPDSVTHLIKSKAKLSQVPQAALAELARDLNLPKALMPCVKEGTSFLAMKVREHEKLPDLAAEVYVTPQGMPYAFASTLAKEGKASRLPIHFLEQGTKLSTLRFRDDGELYLDGSGKPTAVPAGHGALAQLFPAAGKVAPTARSLFIRNIDNVMGTSPEALAATESFLAGHRLVLDAVLGIRAAFAKGDVSAAATIASSLLVDTPARTLTRAEEHVLTTSASLRPLWEVQFRLFHSSAGAATQDHLVALYDRPVNTVGQVPNTGKDVGGTPCFVRGSDGTTPKICVEVPHASEQDRTDYLANPAKATHFNPVFVAAEITTDAEYYARKNRDFWLLSQKSYRGVAVCYYETVLYELLGNSDLANCLFVEVPRLVFNPHKTLADAVGRHASHWLG